MADRGFADFCLELLESVGPVSARHMFGGYGIYAGDVMFALIAHDTLYLKADDQTRDGFLAAGCEPFGYDSPRRGGRMVSRNYHSAPMEAMDRPAAMAPWATAALAAARRAQATKKPRRRRAGVPA